MPRWPEDHRLYTSMPFDTDGTESVRPCGCSETDGSGWVSLCRMHAFAPTMYDCLRQIVSTPLRGDEAIRATTEVLTGIESARMATQVDNKRQRRRRAPYL